MARRRRRRSVRGYAGVKNLHPYAGVRVGCWSIGCLLLPVVFIGIPALGAAVVVWR
jgi:hypothetical protein